MLLFLKNDLPPEFNNPDLFNQLLKENYAAMYQK